jgi:sRNA-binding protein
MMHLRIMPRSQLEELIDYLSVKYPKTFFTQPHLKQPLKKNILLDLERDRVLDEEKRVAAVTFYQNDWNYEATLLAGAKRIDLDGKEVGTVTEQEQNEARKRVQAQKQQLREKKDPITIMRKLHANGEISTDQLSKVSAPPLARPPMTKAKTDGVDLTQLYTLLNSTNDIVAKTENVPLQSAVAVAALKVLVAEANKLIAVLEKHPGG